MDSALGVVVVGLGAIGREHAAIYTDLPNVNLVGVVDPLLAEGTDRTEWEGVQVHPTLSAALQDPRVHAVSLCTPDHVHYKDATLVLEAGRDLLIEKPIAVIPEQVRDLVTLAEASDRIVMPGQTLRFESRYHMAKQYVSSGALGQLVHGYIRRNNKVNVAARADGRVAVSYFLGVHDVDALQWITGSDVQWVQAAGTQVRDASGKQSAAVMATLSLDGALVQLEAAWALPDAYPTDLDARFRLVGSQTELSIDSFDSGIHVTSGAYTLPMTGGMPLYGRSQGPLREELAHFVRCCLTREAPAVTMRQAGQAVLVIDAIERSIDSGRREHVESL